MQYGGVPEAFMHGSGIEEADFRRGLVRSLSIVRAMTPEERRNPDLLLDRPRRDRIANGAAVPIADVEELLVARQGIEIMFRRIERSRPRIG